MVDDVRWPGLPTLLFRSSFEADFLRICFDFIFTIGVSLCSAGMVFLVGFLLIFGKFGEISWTVGCTITLLAFCLVAEFFADTGFEIGFGAPFLPEFGREFGFEFGLDQGVETA